MIKLKQFLGRKVPRQELIEAYNKAVCLDSKPEKGERKIADDFIVLANEQAEYSGVSDMLYMVSVNELALQLSPYNFDIAMHQALLYDRLGMSVSFVATHIDLGIKSVQMESLGFLQLRHTLKYASYESLLKPVMVKF